MGPTIRIATEADAAAVAAIYAPIVEGTAISFEVDPPSETAMRERISETLRRFPWLVCERGGRVLGYAYAGAHGRRAAYQWSVDVSVYVAAEARRAGVGRGLYESLLAVLGLQGFVNAYAAISLPNPASVGLHRSVGFEPVCVFESVGYKDGSWHDVGWWQRSLDDHDANPDPPRALPAVRGSDEWEAAVSTGESTIEG